MIVVTGATGRLGRAIVEQVLRRRSAGQIGVSVREPDKAGDLAAKDVRVRRGNYNDPQGLLHAFEGATQVLLVSTNAAASGDDPLRQHRDAIQAAREAGARRILYTSHVSASPTSAFAPGRNHAATEVMLRDSGVPFTALRNGFYASHAVDMLADALPYGKLALPADGKVAWTAHADLAEAAAIILCDEGRFDGPTPPLTGAYALDYAELAVLASNLAGSPLGRAIVSDGSFAASLAARGVPEPARAIALGVFEASRQGAFATVDVALRRLLGRAPATMRDLFVDFLERPEA